MLQFPSRYRSKNILIPHKTGPIVASQDAWCRWHLAAKTSPPGTDSNGDGRWSPSAPTTRQQLPVAQVAKLKLCGRSLPRFRVATIAKLYEACTANLQIRAARRHMRLDSDCVICTLTSSVSCLRSSPTPRICTCARRRFLVPWNRSRKRSGVCTRPARGRLISRRL